MLTWLQIQRKPVGWHKELLWILVDVNGKVGEHDISSVCLLKSSMRVRNIGILTVLVIHIAPIL